MATALLPDSVQISGSLTVLGGIIGQTRSGLTADTSQAYPLPIVGFRVHDAFQTALGSAGTDDLGLSTGTYGTGHPIITAGDLKAAGATTRYARALFQLPPEYPAGEAVSVRLAAGMVTTAADNSATADVQACKIDRDGTVSGGDLVSTAAQSCNSTSFAELTFALNAGGLSPGDTLDIRVALAVNDASTVTVVDAAIAAADVLLTIKG